MPGINQFSKSLHGAIYNRNSHRRWSIFRKLGIGITSPLLRQGVEPFN